MNRVDFDYLMSIEAHKKRIPINGEFEITSRCNLDCVMCYTRKSPTNTDVISKEMTKDEIVKIARDARDAGMIYLLLTGGEIFLRNDFKKIYEELMELGLIISLYTNGTMINEEIADWLSQMPPNVISITIYGANSDTYKRVTGRHDGFEKTINAIDTLLSKGLPVELKTIWLKDNVSDYFDIYNIAKERGLILKSVNYVFPIIDSENSNPIGSRLDPFELAKFELETEKMISKNLDELTSIEPDFYSKDKGAVNDNKTIIEVVNDAFDCGVGKTTFHVSWDGYISPCGIIDDIKYHFSEDTFMDIYNNLIKDCSKIKRFEYCDNCDYKEDCFPCPARRKIETGSYYALPLYLCEHAENRNFLKNQTIYKITVDLK